MPKPGDGQTALNYVSGAGFEDAWQGMFAHLLRWADEQSRRSPWNWVDRNVILEAYFLAVERDGNSSVLKALRRVDGQATAFDPIHTAPQAAAALVDVQSQVRAANRNKKLGQPRQFTSQVLPVSNLPQRRTVCIGYEFPGQPGQPGQLLVVAIDFTSLIANEARHSPRHLFFVADRDGTYVTHPDEAKIGTRLLDDLDAHGKPRFDFQQVPWAANQQTPAESDSSQGESQAIATFANDLRYAICRKVYEAACRSATRRKGKRSTENWNRWPNAIRSFGTVGSRPTPGCWP